MWSAFAAKKDVIKNQFKDKNNDNHIQGNPDYDNIIEWEE